MNYDEAVKMSDPGLALKEKFYQNYIKPLLKRAPAREHFAFLDNVL